MLYRHCIASIILLRITQSNTPQKKVHNILIYLHMQEKLVLCIFENPKFNIMSWKPTQKLFNILPFPWNTLPHISFSKKESLQASLAPQSVHTPQSAQAPLAPLSAPAAHLVNEEVVGLGEGAVAPATVVRFCHRSHLNS